MSHPIVLIELNEVPNKVLDYYRKTSAFMDQFLSKSHRYETITPDQIQLDPWIAWPTLHRGVNDENTGCFVSVKRRRLPTIDSLLCGEYFEIKASRSASTGHCSRVANKITRTTNFCAGRIFAA